MSYSQFGEDKLIEKFFENRTGSLLDIGANDGRTISNSLLLIEKGWSGVLVEASPIAFKKLKREHENNENVFCINKCLSDQNGKTTFYHNIDHYGKGDTDLLSTIVRSSFEDSSRWFKFSSFEIECFDFKTFYESLPIKKFNFLSIDIEGMDLSLLKQMNLLELGVEVLVIEYNNNSIVREKIIEYCKNFGLSEILFDNKTNLILALK